MPVWLSLLIALKYTVNYSVHHKNMLLICVSMCFCGDLVLNDFTRAFRVTSQAAIYDRILYIARVLDMFRDYQNKRVLFVTSTVFSPNV